jgi:malonate decarboxylase beta subunit
LLRAARDHVELPRIVLLLLDSGGVRLQEANAGELAVAEVMRAIIEARGAGVTVLALVGGRAGAFGGAGLTAATCSGVAISEQGRLGVSGPEVIETNEGVEEFDSQDKALVWSVTGGRNRRLIGGADAYSEDTMAGFRRAALALLDRVRPFNLATLQEEQQRLSARQALLGDCASAVAMWAKLAITAPDAVRDMDDDSFVAVVTGVKGEDHVAR